MNKELKNVNEVSTTTIVDAAAYLDIWSTTMEKYMHNDMLVTGNLWNTDFVLAGEVNLDAVYSALGISADRVRSCELRLRTFSDFRYNLYDYDDLQLHSTSRSEISNEASNLYFCCVPISDIYEKTGKASFIIEGIFENWEAASFDLEGNKLEIQIKDEEATITGISIANAPTKTTYIEGNVFDPAGMIVKANYSDGTSEIITDFIYPTAPLTVGTSYVTISYENFTATTDINVRAKSLTSIAVTKDPTKTSYIEGETIDVSGMEVTAYFNNGTSAVVTDISITPTAAVLGSPKLSISYSYSGLTRYVDFPITVVAKTLVGISLGGSVRDLYNVGETFDPAGLKVIAHYDNGLSDEAGGYTLAGTGPFVRGNYDVTVSYSDKTVTFGVSVEDTDTYARATRDFTLAGIAAGSADLRTGDLRAQFGDVAADESVVGISHVYGAGEETVCGKNFRLSLHETLTKEESQDAYTDHYVYTDGGGEKHKFAEYYYYTGGGKRIYVRKADVTAGLDGRLTYNGNEVKKEQVGLEGLTAVTEIAGMKNAELIEQRQDEVKQLEEQTETYRTSLKSVVVMDTDTGEIYDRLKNRFDADGNLSKAYFDNFVDVADNRMLLPENEALNYKNLKLQSAALGLQVRSLDLQRNSAGHQIGALDTQNTALAWQQKFNDAQRSGMYAQESAISAQQSGISLQQNSLNHNIQYMRGIQSDSDNILKSYERNYYSDSVMDMQNQNGNLNSQYSALTGQNSNLNLQRSLLSEQNTNLAKQQSDIIIQKTDLNNQTSHIASTTTNTESQRVHLSAQIAAVLAQRAQYITEAKRIYKEYANAQNSLAYLKRHIPVVYLTDGSVVKGFSANGRLTAIYDNYDNSVFVRYDDSGKIEFVADNKDRRIAFGYEGGLLRSVTDTNGHKTEYTYDGNDRLTIVALANGKTLELKYDGDMLVSVTSSDKIVTHFRYDGTKVTTIENRSQAASIAKDFTVAGDRLMSLVSIAYSPHETTVTEDGIVTHYIFDRKGNAVGGYADRMGVITEPASFAFVRNECEYAVTAVKGKPDRAADVGGQTVGGKQIIKTVGADELEGAGEFMFSAFAQGDSSATNRRYKTAFGERGMNGEFAKFELCAAAVYADGTDEFVVSYDPLNTGKQWAAVPVALRTDGNGNVIPPLRVELYADYSANNGTAVFDTFAFTEAEWKCSKSENFNVVYSAESRRSLSDTGAVKSETEYFYGADNKPTRKRTKNTVVTGGGLREFYAAERCYYNAAGQPTRTDSFIEGEESTAGVNVEEIFYDEKGNRVKTVKWNTLDPVAKFYDETERAEDGRIIAEIREDGGKTAYRYADGTNVVCGKIAPNGGRTVFGRDPLTGDVTSVSGDDDGEANKTVTLYNCGVPVEYRSGTNTIGYVYDGDRRKTAVTLNGETYANYAYRDGSESDTVSVTLHNTDGDTTTATDTDKDGNVLRVTVGGVTQLSNKYDTDGKLVKATDGVTGSVLNVTYNAAGQTASAERKNGDNVEIAEIYAYDAYGAVTEKTLSGEVAQTYAYAYKDNAAHDLDYCVLPGGVKNTTKRDVYGRLSEKVLSVNGNEILGRYIYYRTVGDRATNLVGTVRYGERKNGKYVIGSSQKYGYDANGNIIGISENGALAVGYTYDKLNRLIREDNKKLGKTFLYAYDNNGNMIVKREAAYSRKDVEELAVKDEKNYFYYGDRLAGHESGGIVSTDFVYDKLGNPTTYNGMTLAWENGRRLRSCGDVTFAYDGYGRRIRKGATTFVYGIDGKLLLQTGGDATLEFIYDDGAVGIKHNSTEYLYKKNVQGDVIGIYGLDGGEKVCYTYDAWGNCVIVKDSDGLGELNPIRYRGYYWDNDLRLYYLESRYYDPEFGRFINADDISFADSDTVNGLNLYAYCLNNPVMFTDGTGTSAVPWWQWMIGGLLLLLGAVFSFIPGGQGLGVSLLASGTSLMTSNIMTAAGVGGKWASIVSSCLSIMGGVALLFSPFAGIGASLLGSGIGGIAGGFISESLGGSFELGAGIGNIIGGILGGKIYDGIKFSAIAKQGILIGKSGQYNIIAKAEGLAYYEGMPGYSILSKFAPKLTAKLGWANNYHYIRNVMRYGGTIFNLGGSLTGSFAKEIALIMKYAYPLISIFGY